MIEIVDTLGDEYLTVHQLKTGNAYLDEEDALAIATSEFDLGWGGICKAIRVVDGCYYSDSSTMKFRPVSIKIQISPIG